MQRTDANIVRLRRGPSPPLQHQRKLGCFVEHRVRHDVRRTPPTDASVSAHQLFLNLPPMMVKVAGQKSDDPRGTRHTHQHYYQHQPHAKKNVLFCSGPQKILRHCRLPDIQLLNLKNKKSSVVNLKIEVVRAHVRALPRSSGAPASWPR